MLRDDIGIGFAEFLNYPGVDNGYALSVCAKRMLAVGMKARLPTSHTRMSCCAAGASVCPVQN
jgi:hypothetical protein